MHESKDLEFKEALTSTFLKTVSAYANYGIGQIVFGVNDKGKAVGVSDIAGTLLAIENKINDSIAPVPEFTLEANEKARTITLTVKEGPHKPYFYKSKAYRRADTSTVEVDSLELSRLVLEGQNLSFEDTDARMERLSFSQLEKALKEKAGIRKVTSDLLRTLELMRPDGTFNVAGELLADVNTFPGIDVARFGESISIFLDRRTFDHKSLLAQYDDALETYRTYYQFEEVTGSTRALRETIPESAFREVIANALVHRQWDVSAHIRVSMFDDRIEVTSPGGLPRGLSRDEYLNGQVSVLRNPIIGGLFFRLRLIERFGTGVLRIRDAYKGCERQPQFEVFEESIKVVLPTMLARLPLSPDASLVLRVITGKRMAISEIVSATGFGKTKAQKLLRLLVADGYARIEGNGRGTRYTA